MTWSRPMYKPARPERSGQTITRKTRKRGPQHRPTKGQESKTGPAQKPQARGLVISFEDGLCEEYGFGHFQPGRPCRIVLAKDNPDIQALLNVRDKTIAAHSLYAIASLILSPRAIAAVVTVSPQLRQRVDWPAGVADGGAANRVDR